MRQNFVGCDRDQVLLLPPDLREWLPAGHLAAFVIETVDQLDLSAVYGYYRQDGCGRPAFEPAMMVALVLYGYAVGVTSSRAIERRCVEDVAFRVIAANRAPDHATIARFLVRHQAALSDLFFEVLALCQRAGMVRVGTVAVDSTKLAANASVDQNRTFDGLRAEAARIIEQAIATDAHEDELYGEARGDELPDELADPRTRAGRIGELLAQARAEREQIETERAAAVAEYREHVVKTGKRKPGAPVRSRPDRDQRRRLARKYNMTDPDSGIVRHRGMLMQGYNVQAVVGDGQVILATAVSAISPDRGQLEPMLAKTRGVLKRVGIDEPLDHVLADTGYWNSAQITRLTAGGLRVLIPPEKRPGARVSAPVAAMQNAMADSKHIYRRRPQIIEPVFAHIKHHRKITRLFKRGRHAVQAEIDLIATTHNLLKLYRNAATPA